MIREFIEDAAAFVSLSLFGGLVMILVRVAPGL